ncbi:Golgin candidate 2 [Linum perenne]
MSNWISSKLRVAETFFEQAIFLSSVIPIDQQAAESLKKNEGARSEDLKLDVREKGGGSVPLKDQLKKKKSWSSLSPERDELIGKRSADPVVGYSNRSNGEKEKEKEKEVLISAKPKPTLTDSDWTELLGSANLPSTSSNRSGGGGGVAGIRGLRKDFRRQVSSEGKKDVNASSVKLKRRSDSVLVNKIGPKLSDAEESRSSNVELQSEVESKEVIGSSESEGNNGWQFQSEEISDAAVSDRNVDVLPVLQKVDGASEVKKGASGVYDRLRNTVKGKRKPEALKSSVSDDVRRGSSYSSDEGSDSGSESGFSSSDSEDERERERRKKILAEKAIAKAAEAVKERENNVARLEGEKQSLEKILEERAKQAALEASELQTTMMETMEAADVEHEKHKNTRMEALSRLATLETANADLSRSLATVQKNLEIEINRVAELRQEVELKEVAVEEFRRKISGTQQVGSRVNQSGASKGVQFEQEILEAECSFLADKIGRLADKAKKLESDIEVTRKDLEEPTEVEVELRRRLGQLTDHLIHKQAQVEALSSEKATLFFRIEAVTKSLEENKSTMSSSNDLESGTWGERANERRRVLEDKLRSGRKHLGSLLEQLDAIFVAGAVFLRRNPSAKIWAGAYLVCLHFWVVYILTSQSGTTPEERSGAVISLENINNTGAV